MSVLFLNQAMRRRPRPSGTSSPRWMRLRRPLGVKPRKAEAAFRSRSSSDSSVTTSVLHDRRPRGAPAPLLGHHEARRLENREGAIRCVAADAEIVTDPPRNVDGPGLREP